MFPRRSAVTRVVVMSVTVCAFIMVLWVTVPLGGESTAWCKRSSTELQNQTALRAEIAEMRTKLNITNTSVSLVNKTAEELGDYFFELCKQLPVNPHNFQYIINPAKVCTGIDVFIIGYVHSAPDHYKRRTSIRETWGNPKNFDHFNLRLVFLVGKPRETSIQEALLMESDMYGDIVQEDFVDSYRNLTYKGIMGLKWVKNHCSHAKFVLKTDDDIFVNIFNVASHLEKIVQQRGGIHNLLLCLVWYRMKVVRDSKSKWYLSRDEFKEDYFPTYCSGSAFIMTPDVSAAMYEASLSTPFFWVDDFYVTGLLAKKVGVAHEKFNSVYTLGPSTFLTKFTEDSNWRTLTFGHVHNINHMVQVWKRVLKDRKPVHVLPDTQPDSVNGTKQVNSISRFFH